MPRTGSPQLRLHATLVVVLYACILAGGALLQHAPLCPNGPGPHCTLCACANPVSLVLDLEPLSPDSGVAVTVIAGAQSRVSVPSASEIGSRAPPAARAVSHPSTVESLASVCL